MTVYVGLGGNVGDDAAIRARFDAVAEALRAFGDVRMSSVYRTAPIGPAQAPFLNAALSLRADPEPLPAELWAVLRELETQLGRDRRLETRWGPRPIDLDILWWPGHAGRFGPLEIPHPRLHLRRFALAPLVELLPDPQLLAWLASVQDQDVTGT